jgi:hypothetical protein
VRLITGFAVTMKTTTDLFHELMFLRCFMQLKFGGFIICFIYFISYISIAGLTQGLRYLS